MRGKSQKKPIGTFFSCTEIKYLKCHILSRDYGICKQKQ